MSVTKLNLNNKIINGAFDYWQRGTSFPAIATTSYFADRWRYVKLGAMIHTVSRSTDVPSTSDSIYSALIDCTTVDAAIAAGDLCYVDQLIEGNVLKSFKNKKMALVFWVKATKTGTSCVSFRNSAGTRSLVKEYTISVTDTWERKTVRIQHDSTGAWLYDTGTGISVDFALAAGTDFQTTPDTWNNGNLFATANQINHCDNTANNFQIADVCFVEDNEGQSRTPDFVYAGRDYFEELQLCRRYYEKSYELDIAPATATVVGIEDQRWPSITIDRYYVPFKQGKRVLPTVVFYNPITGATGTWNDFTSSTARSVNTNTISSRGFSYEGVPSGANNPVGGHWTADAEL